MRTVVVFLAVMAAVWAKECPANKSNSKLFCYFSKLTDIDGCRCSYVILPADADVKSVERVREVYEGVKVLVTVNEFNQGLIDILKTSKVDGLEIDLKKLDSKNDISDFISTVRSKLGSDLYLALSVPARAETLAKYYDFKGLSKHADVFILQTAFLGASKNVTFHPSRLSGLWDTQNTDSMVDLVSGLGAPLSKVVISAPVQAFHFTLQNAEYSAPGSPALELKTITRSELCKEMKTGSNWTLERDQDQAGPYIFRGKNWIAFEDSSSIDVKAKYSRVRGLAGLALKDVSQDGGDECGASVLEAAHDGLSRQARAPRGAVLHSLERELQGAASSGGLEGVRLSPYRISRVVDVEGRMHVVRQDTRTEFSCSRQGFFAHPRSCNRFYRCVLFDQSSDEFSVFEFDCPAGLAFDERVEVCVWPGSLPEGKPCAGSSEIAPVPRSRFVCPHEPGYYADPENCRWFFACMDHGDASPSAYEFRCPYGLVFDSDRLMCEWPWLVPRCASGSGLGINLGQEYAYGGTGYSSASALDHYSGLGSLGVVRLGGLTGEIQQPVIYSNVGGGGYPSATIGGLGIKATQSLHNAGLLRGTGIYDNNIQYSSDAARSNSAAHYLDASALNQQTIGSLGSSQHGAGSGSYSYASNSGQGASSLNQQLIGSIGSSGSSEHGSGSGSYASNYGQDASSLNQQLIGSIGSSGSSEHGSGSGSYSYASTSGQGASSLNQQLIGSSGSSEHGSGSGSYSYASNYGQDASSLNQQLGSSGSGSSQFDGSVGGGHISDTILRLGDGNSFGVKTIQNLLDNNKGSQSVSGVASSGSSDYQGTRNGESGSYIEHSNLGFDASDSFGLRNSQDVLNSNNEGGSYNGVGSSQYEGSSIGGSRISTIANSNLGLYASSSLDSRTTQQLLNNNNDGSYKGVVHSGSSQYQGSNGRGSGSYVVNSNLGLDAYNLLGTNNNDNEGSHNGFSNYESSQYRGSSNGESGSYNGVEHSESSQYQGSNGRGPGSHIVNSNLGLDASNLLVTNTNQQLLNKNNDGSYNGFSNFESSRYQGSSNGESGTYTSNQNLGLDTSSLLDTTQHHLNSGNQGSYQGGSSSYSNSIIRHDGATAFDAGTSRDNLNIKSGVYNSLNAEVGSGIDGQAGLNTNNLRTYYAQDQVSGGGNQQVLFSENDHILANQGLDSTAFGGKDFSQLNFESKSLGNIDLHSNHIQQENDASHYQHGVSGNINIVGGGYSAVEKSHVQVNHNGENNLGLVQTTVAPVSISTYHSVPTLTSVPVSISTYSPVPTVTAVPVPTLSTPTAFEQYNGGVIANIPQLQYQVGRSGVSNISSTFGNFFSSTPSSVFLYNDRQRKYGATSSGAKSYNYQSHIPHGVAGSLEVQGVSSTLRPEVDVSRSGGYIYNKPSIAFEETPKINTYTPSSTVTPIQYLQPQVSVHSVTSNSNSNYNAEHRDTAFQGYSYEKPSVTFEENPLPRVTTSAPIITVQPQVLVSSTVAPVVPLQPITHTYNQNIQTGGYQYPKPSIAFVERPSQPVIISRFSIKKPVIQETYARPTVAVNTYRQEVGEGYRYEKPSISFEERPVIQSTIRPVVLDYQQPIGKTSWSFKDVVQAVQPVSTYLPVTERSHVVQQTIKPVVSTYLPATERQISVQPARPAIVSSYFHQEPAVSSYTFKDVLTQTTARPLQRTYSYSTSPQPIVIQSTIRPAVNYLPATERPTFVHKHVLVDRPVSTYSPVTERPVVVPSYNYIASTTTKPVVAYTYTSPTPAPYVPQIISTTPAPQISVQRQKNVEFRGYNYPRPSVSFVEEPVPSVVTQEVRQPIEEVPFVKKTAYVTGNTNVVNPIVIENYQAANYEKVKSKLFGQSVDSSSNINFGIYETVSSTPAPVQQVYIQSTPRPTYSSTLASVLAAKSESGSAESDFQYYESRYSSTPRTVTEGYLYPKPTVVFEEKPAAPSKEYLPVTTSRPIVRYSFSSLDDDYQYVSTESTTAVPREYLPVRSRVRVTSPVPTYVVPVSTETSTLAREYLPVRSRVRVTTPEPSYVVPTVTIPSREYLPGRSRARITTAIPNREYLPVNSRIRVTTDGVDSESLEVSSRRPVKVIKVVRPRTKTIIKQNDMHPILSAKLGAQCTCVSNTVNLRKKQRIIVVEDDDDEDDGYVVSNEDQSGTVIENYEYEPQRVVDITPTPEIYVQSTTNGIVVPSPSYPANRRVRVRPSTTVAYELEEDDGPSDRQIAKAVRTGLKLVKQAAKEGAKEGAEEAIANYSPRTGSSREGIECQRAGLFRHPNQCNKFYSCKWDCKKNRFTLHVFNCPVHLTFDNNLGACNWPSQGPACMDDTLLPNE
ncbi:unnamed protein product [Phaedon cochleariae]|uniref:Chitinase n=1 Tax=Phaedon cochleariae TaxID=80249 RepID=A0A9P0D8E2_PHACE|nr:unnamed protein product [Phaedon cochleariae]